jgi:CheY-like chemotaxis protein
VAKRRLLLADDSTTIQKVVNLTFADEGIEVVAVGDGDAAMQKFVEATPDLVMIDVNMPGLDGYRLCEMIKQDDETKAIPVILLVGSFEPFDENEARRVGADDFLTKPFQSIRQLVSKVSDLLDAGTSADNSLYPLDAAPDGDFTESLEATPDGAFDLSDAPVENLGDAGMDDEMIQTAQIGSLPVDETHKYESEPIYESFVEDIEPTQLKQPSDSENLTAELENEDWAKTPPSSSKANLEESVNDLNREKNTALPLNFDDFDLLEFPQTLHKDASSETVSSADSEFSDEAAQSNRDAAGEISKPAFGTFAVAPQTENLSPEIIEAIANRVVEKLSNDVIKRVVSEVLSQMEEKR